MSKRQRRSRFESEVHLGFIAIVCLLLLVNIIPNYMVYRARSTQHDETTRQMQQVTLAVTRSVRQSLPGVYTPEEIEEARIRYNLSDLMLLPSKPADNTAEAKRAWLASIAHRFPLERIPRLADRLFQADYNELTRGEGAEYFYLHPVPSGKRGGELLILAIERPELAYLDDARDLALLIQLGAVGAVVVIYVLLVHFIFRPFRRIRKKAREAGRPVDLSQNESEAIVQEYERIIEELSTQKAELRQLNIAIKNKADSIEQFNQYLLESSHSGVITLDTNGKVVSINETAGRLLDVIPQKSIGQQYDLLFRELSELTVAVQNALLTGESCGYTEYRRLSREQETPVFGVTISSIRTSSQSNVGLLIIMNDLTEMARLRRELEERNKLAALGEMAAGLAHQLRNSIGAISGYGTLLKNRLKYQGESVDKATALLDETREAGELITRFLVFARPFDYTPMPLVANELIEEIIDQFKIRDDIPNVEFDVAGTTKTQIHGDPVLLKQALSNIMDNAIKAYDGGRAMVRVAVDDHPGVVEITVEDHGAGIAEDQVDKIFTPFFSSRPSGTGLGLPLSKKIITLHGGSIRVESKLGLGTRFVISLPKGRSLPRVKGTGEPLVGSEQKSLG